MSQVGRPKGSGQRPSRAVVREVVEEAARAANVDFSSVLTSRTAASTRARRQAWLAILAETGCSMGGLADVWGCHRQAIMRTVRMERS